MGQGDLFQITSYQTLLNEDILNVYYYRQTVIGTMAPSDLIDLLNAFKTNVIDQVRKEQVDTLVHTLLEVRNLSNNLDIATIIPGVSGMVAAAAAAILPTYVTVGYKLVRESLVTRHGYKRFSGLSEAQVTGNTYVPASAANVTAIQTALAMDLGGPDFPIVEPVIVKRPFVPPVGTAYQYSSIGSAVLRGLGSQNSRKA